MSTGSILLKHARLLKRPTATVSRLNRRGTDSDVANGQRRRAPFDYIGRVRSYRIVVTGNGPIGYRKVIRRYRGGGIRRNNNCA